MITPPLPGAAVVSIVMRWLTAPCCLCCCVCVVCAAIWSEYPYLSYQNSLAPSNTLYTIYNASQGWPTNGDLLEAGPGPRFQFPLTYEGRT